jgi:ribosomal protein L16 Arg81 hydroxylase
MKINADIEPKKNISFLVSIPFHKTIDNFCKEHSISKSLLIRTSLNQMINQYQSDEK